MNIDRDDSGEVTEQCRANKCYIIMQLVVETVKVETSVLSFPARSPA